MQGRTSGVTAESTVLASHQVPYSDGVTRFGCSSYTYAPQRYIIYSNPTTRTWSEEMNESPRRYFQISTWAFSNLHVEKKNSPRGDEIKLRRNQMKLRRKCFSPTWRIKNSSVEIWNFPRGYRVTESCDYNGLTLDCLQDPQIEISRNACGATYGVASLWILSDKGLAKRLETSYWYRTIQYSVVLLTC